MAKRADFIALALAVLVMSYLLAIGATWNGILNPQFPPLTLGMTALLVGGWLFMRRRAGWRWHGTALDGAMLLWVLAFGISLLANLDAARRIAIGLWYMGLYIGVWYALHDLLANRPRWRDTLVDALLIAGIVIVAFGYVQLQGWLAQTSRLGIGAVALPRPVSVFGNPNFLSSFLIVLIPLILSRAALAKGAPPRALLLLYALLSALLLLLTSSRGAWLGLLAGGLLWGVLLLAHHNLLSLSRLRGWWNERTRTLQAGLAGGALLSAVILMIIGIIFIRSFSVGGRSLGLRVEMYDAAVQLFAEKPLTGQGLFTYGRGLVRLPDIRPDKPHSHAHNAPLQIAAELGLPGVAALLLTVAAGARAAGANWQAMRERERVMLMGAAGGVLAFGVHHLTDLPAMMPAIALTGLLALALLVAPEKQEFTAEKRQKEEEFTTEAQRKSREGYDWVRDASRARAVGIVALWAALLVSGLWSSRVNGDYVNALRAAVGQGDYRGAAAQLDAVIAADPALSLYHYQRAFLLGMAAHAGDEAALREAIAGFEDFTRLDPGYSAAWANLAALRWEAGEREAAYADMRRAWELNVQDWRLALNLAQYASEMGDAAAIGWVAEVLREYPDASLYPELSVYVEGDAILDALSLPARAVVLLEGGQTADAARVLAGEAADVTLLPATTAARVLDSLVLLAQGDLNRAADTLAQAESGVATNIETAWIHMGRARLAAALGDEDGRRREREAAYASLEREPLAGDDPDAINIPYAQFLRLAIPRFFLPQVTYPVDDPVLLYLLERT